MKEVKIFGAGLSGLVAAINLARDGFKVIVYEREKQIGGSPQYHPSVHMTPLDPEPTWNYIGCDLSSAFHPLERFSAYFGKDKIDLDPSPLYVVERGKRETSLDYLLFKMAEKEKVEFEFSHRLREEELNSLPENTIISCGLHHEMFVALNIPYVSFKYFINNSETKPGNFCFGYWDFYTPDYGYVAITNGLVLALVFSRSGKLRDDAGELFRRRILETEGIDIGNTKHFQGANPLQPTLFADRFILAGNLAGMWDPVFCFGIVGALHSGKIAAIAVTDREKGYKEFRRLTKNHWLLYKISNVVNKTPWSLRKLYLSTMLKYPEISSPIINFMSKGIPGWTGKRIIRRANEL